MRSLSSQEGGVRILIKTGEPRETPITSSAMQ